MEPETQHCPDCDWPCKEEEVTYQFPYGVGNNPAMLTVTHLGFVCTNKDCGCLITDWRGEYARSAAVKEHTCELFSAAGGTSNPLVYRA